jgi:photosystem II stability/assembly factor-like uncharacterized protein
MLNNFLRLFLRPHYSTFLKKTKMKNISHLICLLLLSQFTNAQWIKQASPTGNTLYDVEFINDKTGFAVGAKGTVLKTTDGTNWQLLTSPAGDDLVSVTAIDSMNVFVTSSGNPAIYRSTDGGSNWQSVLSDLVSFYITHTPGKRLFSVSRSIYNSNNNGDSWNPVASVNSTSSYFHISFANNKTGMAAGNISGFVTYSADFLRTFDGGNHWYHNDPFKFPNANGFTAMNFLNADSVFMFTNFYNRFAEGDSSQLLLLHDFKLRKIDSSVVFKHNIVVRSFQDKIRDCKFFETKVAYAAGDRGIIYISKNGGLNWKADYPGKTPLHALFMLNEGNGFAVGDNGLILKKSHLQPQAQPQKLKKSIPVISSQE